MRFIEKGEENSPYYISTNIPKTQKTRTFFFDIFKSESSILAVGQNRKIGIKETQYFRDFRGFRVFDLPFFYFSKNFNILQ